MGTDAIVTGMCAPRNFAQVRSEHVVELSHRWVPIGHVCVNMFGTLVLAVVWDLQRLPNHAITANFGGNLVSCQVLQAIEDGFCGCLTTVSTWVLELSTLRRRHSYQYGFASIGASLMIVVVVMGSLKWTVGLSQPVCISS